MSIKDGTTQFYLSILSLEKTNYLDTGYYYCSPLNSAKILIQQFKKIYIFVEGEYLTSILKIKIQFNI